MLPLSCCCATFTWVVSFDQKPLAIFLGVIWKCLVICLRTEHLPLLWCFIISALHCTNWQCIHFHIGFPSSPSATLWAFFVNLYSVPFFGFTPVPKTLLFLTETPSLLMHLPSVFLYFEHTFSMYSMFLMILSSYNPRVDLMCFQTLQRFGS